jgi:hypothetical protein
MTVNQGQENAILNKALSPVPVPHLTGAELNADVTLGDLVFNTIDVDGIAFILTGIDGWLTLPSPQFPEVSRGIQGDGDYDVSGRYQSRLITLAGSILVPDRTHVPAAQQKLVTTIDLVRKGAWLKFNENPTRAVFVRLSGQPNIDTVNARGRIDFSIGLKAADPIKYEWNTERSDGYFIANVKASNYDNSETGTVTINNKGNYPVSGIYEVTGPIIGPSAAIFNNANADLITFAQSLRPRRELEVTYKAMASGVATLILNTVSDLQAGDEVYTRFLETSIVSTASRTSGSSVVVITTTTSHGYSTGDRVVLSGVNAEIDNIETTITRTGAADFIFNTVATTALSSTTGTVFNITNDRYNGTFFIDSVNTISNTITYTTIYNETYANVQSFSALAVRSADLLEIDTYNQEVALNGETFQQRAKLATLIDWIELDAGDNEITLDDSNQNPIYIYKVGKTGTPTATLTSPVEHGFQTNDVILVSGVPSLSGDTFTTTSRKEISSYSRSGTTMTINSTSHGFAVADVVVIIGIDLNEIDGEYVVATSATNSFTVTTVASATVYTTTLPSESAYAKKILKVLEYNRSGYTANVFTTTTHGLNVNNFVNIYGISSGLDGVDGLQKITAINALSNSITFSTISPATVATTNVTGATVARRFPITATTPYSFSYDNGGSASSIATTTFGALVSVDDVYATPSSVTKSSNVVTVVTTRPHGFEPNNLLQVENVGAGFNAGIGDPVAIANVARAGTTLTVRTAAAHALVANDIVQIYGTSVAEADVFVDGSYSVATTDNTTHFTVTTIDSGTISSATQERAFAADKVRVAYYTKNAGASAYSTVAGTTVWFYTKTNHNLVTGDYVYVENLTSSINGLQGTVTNVNATFFTIVSDNLSLVKVATITAASNTGTTVTIAAASHGFTRDTSIWVNSSQANINGARTVTFANTTHFQFVNPIATGTLNTSTSGFVGRHYETSTIARAYPIAAVPNATTFTYNNRTGPATNVTNQINGTTSNTAGEVVLNGDGRMSVYYRSGWIA